MFKPTQYINKQIRKMEEDASPKGHVADHVMTTLPIVNEIRKLEGLGPVTQEEADEIYENFTFV